MRALKKWVTRGLVPTSQAQNAGNAFLDRHCARAFGLKHRQLRRFLGSEIFHPLFQCTHQGGDTYRQEYAAWGVIEHFAIAQVVTQDGYYRFRITAKVDNRSRTVPNKFLLQYAKSSPIQVEQEVPQRTAAVLR